MNRTQVIAASQWPVDVGARGDLAAGLSTRRGATEGANPRSMSGRHAPTFSMSIIHARPPAPKSTSRLRAEEMKPADQASTCSSPSRPIKRWRGASADWATKEKD
ncbi:hypothetical protein GCM10023066_11960 [Nocardioides kongjuensis]